MDLDTEEDNPTTTHTLPISETNNTISTDYAPGDDNNDDDNTTPMMLSESNDIYYSNNIHYSNDVTQNNNPTFHLSAVDNGNHANNHLQNDIVVGQEMNYTSMSNTSNDVIASDKDREIILFPRSMMLLIWKRMI